MNEEQIKSLERKQKILLTQTPPKKHNDTQNDLEGYLK